MQPDYLPRQPPGSDRCRLGGWKAWHCPGEDYKLAFDGALLSRLYRRPDRAGGLSDLLPDPALLLSGEGGYRDLDGDNCWWVPSGRLYFSTNAQDGADEEPVKRTAAFSSSPAGSATPSTTILSGFPTTGTT